MTDAERSKRWYNANTDYHIANVTRWRKHHKRKVKQYRTTSWTRAHPKGKCTYQGCNDTIGRYRSKFCDTHGELNEKEKLWRKRR